MAEYVKVGDLNLVGLYTSDGYAMTDIEAWRSLLDGVPTVELAKETRRRPLVFGYSYTAPLRRGPLERRLVGPWEKVDDECHCAPCLSDEGPHMSDCAVHGVDTATGIQYLSCSCKVREGGR